MSSKRKMYESLNRDIEDHLYTQEIPVTNNKQRSVPTRKEIVEPIRKSFK